MDFVEIINPMRILRSEVCHACDGWKRVLLRVLIPQEDAAAVQAGGSAVRGLLGAQLLQQIGSMPGVPRTAESRFRYVSWYVIHPHCSAVF